MESAIRREKALKGWLRVWKLHLVEESNQDWRDLRPDIIGVPSGGVIPAQAGIRGAGRNVDSRLRGNDGPRDALPDES